MNYQQTTSPLKNGYYAKSPHLLLGMLITALQSLVLPTPKESTMWMTSRKTQNRHYASNCAKPPVLMCLVLHVVKGGSIDFLCALQEFELSPLVNKTHLSLAFARKLGTIVYYNDRSWFQFTFSCMLVSLYTKVYLKKPTCGILNRTRVLFRCVFQVHHWVWRAIAREACTQYVNAENLIHAYELCS